MENLQPEEQTTVNSYNAYALTYDAEHPDTAYWLSHMKRFYELMPEGRILEVGSATGRDARILASLGYDYIGTDISSGLVRTAQEAALGLEFYPMSIYDLKFPDGYFDGFWAAATLLHIPKSRIQAALTRLASVLKPGGIGFISLKAGEGERLESDTRGGQNLQRHFVYWRTDEFIRSLHAANFEIVDYSHHDSDRGHWLCFYVQNPAH